MKLIRNLAIAALATALSACAVQPSKDSAKWSVEAPESYQAAVSNADWNSATVIDVNLFDDQFTPMLLTLSKGQPYVLRLTNKDPYQRSLVGSNFLDSMAIAGVSGADEITKASVVRSVTLTPGETREIKAIPMKSGRFEFRRAGSLAINTFGGVFEPFGFMDMEAYGVAYVE